MEVLSCYVIVWKSSYLISDLDNQKDVKKEKSWLWVLNVCEKLKKILYPIATIRNNLYWIWVNAVWNRQYVQITWKIQIRQLLPMICDEIKYWNKSYSTIYI